MQEITPDANGPRVQKWLAAIQHACLLRMYKTNPELLNVHLVEEAKRYVTGKSNENSKMVEVVQRAVKDEKNEIEPMKDAIAVSYCCAASCSKNQ